VLRLSAHGVVVDGAGQVLLAQRDDTRTWAPPGGAVDAGELPPEAVTREVAEETGLEVVPARLTAVYHTPFLGLEYLIFGFRCLQAGGELRPSSETPRLGYFKPTGLPRRMLDISRAHVQDSLAHVAPVPILRSQSPSIPLQLAQRLIAPVIYRWLAWRRQARGEPPYAPPPPWQLNVSLTVEDANGRTLWVRASDGDGWHLPCGARHDGEAPWMAARRILSETTALRSERLALRELSLQGEAEALLRFTGLLTGNVGGNGAVRLFGDESVPAEADAGDRAWLDRLGGLPAGAHFTRSV
jgi:ADP-ribose pyrophosphatase YjhB (NUDIX family)